MGLRIMVAICVEDAKTVIQDWLYSRIVSLRNMIGSIKSLTAGLGSGWPSASALVAAYQINNWASQAEECRRLLDVLKLYAQ